MAAARAVDRRATPDRLVILRVDASDALPVYEQVRLQLSAMVAAGVLSPGAQLPTIRQLAADLGLAKGTIAKAYEALERDGVVESRGRSGTVVAARPGGLPSSRRLAADAAERLAVAALQSGLTRAEALSLLAAAYDRLA